MGLEFELKYAATPEIQRSIQKMLGDAFQEIAMETTYYDTPAGEFSARRWTLRRRLENSVSVCTLKTPAGALGRGEWEWEADSIEDAIQILCKLSGQEPLGSIAAGGLVPICGARFTRLAATVTTEDAVLEVALDTGVLTGGGREMPLCEVEIELKSGSRQGTMLYAAFLERKFGLQPEPRSKFRRALDLALDQ